MTHPPEAQPNTRHLTEEQFGELLAPSAETSNLALAEAHLASCEQCSAELASLRDSLSLFRKATGAYAENELRGLPQWSASRMPVRRPILQPVYWAVAAALLLAAVLPLEMFHRHAAPPPPATVAVTAPDRPAVSDEALFESVNSEISEAVPTPMQALADPTSNATSFVQNSTQRKD
jgi:anti-sigma factor RsiW